MTEAEAKELIDFMHKKTNELLKSKDACWKFLIDAGIETEESRRKHEEKMQKRGKKK
ncbi:hypothetical protein ACQ86N_01675 [Puia sp. P3]|uniref:hypothetical protein n=1 Tax=Puia sp. P3 TaxID=3423952 RepID=UPI003D674945